MAYYTKKDCSKRNLCIKVVISMLITVGIFCAIFAICSCRWFVFAQDGYSENRVVQDWTFLPERDMDETISIGLFRYQKAFIDDAMGATFMEGSSVVWQCMLHAILPLSARPWLRA